MPSNFQQVIGLLSSLSRSELDEVRKRAAFFLQHKAVQRAVVEQEDWLLEGVLTELERRGRYSNRGQFKLKNTGTFAGVSTKLAEVRRLLEKAAPNISPSQKKYLGEVVAEELANYLSTPYLVDGKIVVRELSINSMLSNIHLAPEAIDRAFPGYMAAGMLGLVVRYQEPNNGR